MDVSKMENKVDVPDMPHTKDCLCLHCSIERDRKRVEEAKRKAMAGKHTAKYGEAQYGGQKFGQGKFA